MACCATIMLILQAQGALTEQEAAQVIHDVLSVLSECHRQHIIYADVKPANFLLKHVYPDARSLVDPSIESRVIEVSTGPQASAVVLPEFCCCPSGLWFLCLTRCTPVGDGGAWPVVLCTYTHQ